MNCAAIPPELFESEFFGHARGAFTGALRDRAGRFEVADGGTLFLDEVGEIPLVLQGKLLRVLQEGSYERVGEERTRRWTCASSPPPTGTCRREATAGRFREDLYYRLHVFPVDGGPAARAAGGHPVLAEHFLDRAAGCTCAAAADAGARPALQQYDWPGNVRELRERHRAGRHYGGNRLHLDLPVPDRTLPVDPVAPAPSEADRILTAGEVAVLERANILRALRETHGKIYGGYRRGQIAGPQAHHPLIPDQSTRYCSGAGLGASVTGSPHASGRLAWRTYRQGRGSDGQTAIRPA